MGLVIVGIECMFFSQSHYGVKDEFICLCISYSISSKGRGLINVLKELIE